MNSLHRHLLALATLEESEAPMLSVYLDLRQPLEALRSKFMHWCMAARIST